LKIYLALRANQFQETIGSISSLSRVAREGVTPNQSK